MEGLQLEKESIFRRFEFNKGSDISEFREWLKGSTISGVYYYGNYGAEPREGYNDVTNIIFQNDIGEAFQMCHGQDCCESVVLDKIYGDLGDIVGKKIKDCQELVFRGNDNCESSTYSLYKISYQDRIGHYDMDVTVQWFGESNGYYDESVDLVRGVAR